MAEGKFRLTTSEWPLLERKKVKWNTMCLPVRKKPSSHLKKKGEKKKKTIGAAAAAATEIARLVKRSLGN